MRMWWFSNGDIGKGSAGKEDGKEWKANGNEGIWETIVHTQNKKGKEKEKKVKHTHAYSIEAKKREETGRKRSSSRWVRNGMLGSILQLQTRK